MLKIGLTGGIGSGKSKVAQYFAALGVPIIDADVIVHELYQPGTTTFHKILKHFGKSYLTPDGNINRKKLRALVFKNKTERIWLEKLLHPQVYARMRKQSATLHAPYCIWLIPLLFETNAETKLDRILVVDAPKTLQIKRVCMRDKTSSIAIKIIINSQLSRKERLKLADDIIYNNSTLAKLRQSVIILHQKYLTLAN